ncbi:MAG: TIM barrel protein [Chloroflexi bacterium]|nr:TIM barrel protein [Chloroflexota bacterium]
MSIRVSCHGITWGRDGLDQCVRDLRQLGFRGFEAFAYVVDDFGLARLGQFQELLARHSLELVALYGGGAMHDPSMFEEVVARNVRLARFIQANGAKRLVLGPGRRPAGGPSRDDLLNAVHCMSEIGRRTLEYGVQACVHPHVNTIVEKLGEIDFVMDCVDPRYVAMAADTAHFRKGNPDVPTAEIDVFRRYADRIKYVHLKDWDPNLPPELTGAGGTAIIKDFVELGQGVVDLQGAINILRESGYDGWLTIELDYTRRTPYESVAMSKDYLVRELNLSL